MNSSNFFVSTFVSTSNLCLLIIVFITVCSIWLFRSNLFLLIIVFVTVSSILVSCTNFLCLTT